MATIQYFAGQGTPTEIAAGSGLGFYGSGGFGTSVTVSEYADNVYITNSAGSTEGPQANNFKWITSDEGGVGSGTINGSPNLPLRHLPNGQATLNIRFSHGSAVATQNAEVRCYDRTNINNAPSGVTMQAAEIIHVDPSQGATSGSGDLDWTAIAGSGSVLDMVSSPGTSGERINGDDTTDTQHDWFVVLSPKPNSVGSKNLVGLFVSLEYL